MQRKPLIGLNADYKSATKDIPGFSYLAEGYADCILKAGGIPVVLPLMDDIEDVIHPECNKVIATGSHGIYRLLGGTSTMVWRKRQKPPMPREGKAKRQMTLIDVLKRNT